MERKQASSLKVSSLGFQQDTYYYPHLRMKKLRVRGTKQLAPDYSKQKSQDLNQVPPTPEPHSVTSLTTSREVRGLKSWSPGHLTTHQKCRPTESEYAFSHDIRPLNYQATFFPLRVICIITGKIIQLAANPISSHKELSKERGLQDFVLTGRQIRNLKPQVLTSCVALSKSLHLFEFQFPYLHNSLQELNKVIPVKRAHTLENHHKHTKCCYQEIEQ